MTSPKRLTTLWDIEVEAVVEPDLGPCVELKISDQVFYLDKQAVAHLVNDLVYNPPAA